MKGQYDYSKEKGTCEMCGCEFELNPEIPTGGME
jgi:hypothetical protein